MAIFASFFAVSFSLNLPQVEVLLMTQRGGLGPQQPHSSQKKEKKA
jgi:hypothetical protein